MEGFVGEEVEGVKECVLVELMMWIADGRAWEVAWSCVDWK